MLTRLSFAFFVIVLSGMFVDCASAVAEDLFPDKALEAAIRRYVFEKRNNKEPLVEKDVENISTIELKGYTFTLDGKKVERKEKIKSLKGLEKCRSLALLDLEAHEIEDVSPIADLKILQSLNLAKNKIKDIKPVEKLTKLQYLKLDNNEISDLTPLAKLENMRSLYLENNKIKDVKSLGNLKKTWSLYLDGNQVKDLMPLAPLANLSSLGLKGNGITDISSLAGLTELKFLFLDNNKITDIKVLVDMAKKDREGSQRFALFWNVYLAGNPLSDEAKSKQLPELKKQSLASRIHFK